ncbi:MAG: acetyl-CoA carboxylase, biotin carboxylase subunit [Actinomycetota bacterium]|jgi:acetyl-CoA/propionyl-CoA carboxylase biotin carboxyl carrier protein|nr:acetyl-CoA carboxylase, biotin carboxylase subunit [Actinomycetota bacterium]
MFKKLLIANRGEIAIRVIRACRDMDISSVAVFSDLDADASHTRMADEAYNVGPGPASESYLRIDNILAAAKRSGAEAVHPGYGFLAENAAFAQAVIDAGLVWVGPSPEVIDGMGDKTAARRAASDAGVATVPGTKEPVTSAEEVKAFVAENGLPLAIKASAGGGGKGFRVVKDESEIEDALAGAAREAQAYFSSDDVYLERYLERPRHIEIQVMGDASGAIISFPERDCSLQRRHQKLVEESPSPALDPNVREAIMEAAARVSKQVGYRNAGTCEFLLDSDGKTFYFLEMNTRLQVEHPVTELVTGIDLVRAQLLVAANEPLGFGQDDVELRGHAIECRINAENPAKKFMPAPGRIGEYREPAGPGVRVDSGTERNAEIPQAYDPLVAKLITYGATRDEARRRMLRALSEYEIEGIKTTIPFHQLMLADEKFVSGDYHTGTVERDMDLSVLAEVAEPKPKPGEPAISHRTFDVELDGKRFAVKVREELESTVLPRKPKPPEKAAGIGGGGAEELVAPMQGTIVKVLVESGQDVKAGDVVCVLEAMKMENSILAHKDGVVEDLKVEPGQSVLAGAPIAVIR